MSEFGEWLAARMRERRWSDSKAAQLCHVSASAVRDWRKGYHEPSLGSVRVIALAFDASEFEIYCLVARVSDDELRAELRHGESFAVSRLHASTCKRFSIRCERARVIQV